MTERAIETDTAPSVAAIITAAGKSSRMGGTEEEENPGKGSKNGHFSGKRPTYPGKKKEYLPLPDYPSVLARTVSVFLASYSFSTILITHPEGGTEEARRALGELSELESIRFCSGGQTRQESVKNGLEALFETSPQAVLIHDAARPWVSQQIIRNVITAVLEYGAAAPVVSPRDAIKGVGPDGWFSHHYTRKEIFAVQTPQGFLFKPILSAHRKAFSEKKVYIDDTEIYHKYVGKVKAVRGDPENRKITYPQDLPQYTKEHNT